MKTLLLALLLVSSPVKGDITPNHMIKMTRAWAMPSAHTFRIKPISELLERYVGDGLGWADPFCGENSPAQFKNDLNPVKGDGQHILAEDFASSLPDLSGALFDPPYSLRQIKEVYGGVGLKMSPERSRDAGFRDVKNCLATKIRPGGLAICFGWNSSGLGKTCGFEPIEYLMVCHGGPHNDTIVTVERKTQ